MKLIGGPNKTVGYLLINGYSVCPEGFGLYDGDVLCRDMRGPGAYASVLRGLENFGPSVANLSAFPYRYKNIDCFGYENSINACELTSGNIACANKHGLGLRCHEETSGENAGSKHVFEIEN